MLSMKRIALALVLCLCLPQAVGAVTHAVSRAGFGLSPDSLTIEDLTIEPGRNISPSSKGRINVVEGIYGNDPPNADFTSSCVELNCNFTDQSSDPDGSIASRTWNFGDGGSSTSANPSHSYASAGTYSVMLTVSDDGGAADSVIKDVTVSGPGNQNPLADFAFSCSDLSCNFTDQSSDPDGSIASRSWAFGDGASSTSANPSHSYAAAGTYSAMLTVTDNGGASDSHARSVVVTSAPAAFLINAAITDAWYDPQTDGQGFFIIVWEESGLIFLSWFTFDTERPPQNVTAHLGEPGHRWLTAQGPYSGDTAALNVYETAGGVFDAPTPAPDPNLLVGTIDITWTGCNSGVLSFNLPSLGLSGDIPIERIVLDKVPACEAAQP